MQILAGLMTPKTQDHKNTLKSQHSPKKAIRMQRCPLILHHLTITPMIPYKKTHWSAHTN